MSREDEELLSLLRAAAARIDPVPDEDVAAARSAIAWLRMDAELASITFDSFEKELAGVRGAVDTDVRMLTFESDSAVIELEIVAAGGIRQLTGQVHPGKVRRVRLESDDGELEVTTDDRGRFAIDDAPRGRARFRVELEDGAIETVWVEL